MITDERIQTFLQSLEPEQSRELAEIASRAREEGVPIVRLGMEHFLQTIVMMNRPKRILEVGTAVGYSALVMSEAEPEVEIMTIELDKGRAELAKLNIDKLNKSDKIHVIEGDADHVLEDMIDNKEEAFDMVFIDAAKGQYMSYWEKVCKLIKKGSVIVTDNCLQEGGLIQARSLISQRDRTIYDRMREFLYNIMHDDKFMTTIIPIGDGVAVSVLR